MRAKLTTRALEALAGQPGQQYDVFDTLTPGLCVRVGTRAKTWVVFYRVHGQTTLRKATLGRYPAVPLSDARKRALDMQRIASTGTDPEAARVQAAETAERDTFSALVALYLERHAKRRKRTWQEDQRLLAKDFGDWNTRPVRSITRRMIRERLDDIAKRAPVMANRSLAALSTVLNFALDREWIDANPAGRLRKPTVEVSRERVLADDEIRAFWQALDAAESAYQAIADEGRRVMVKRLDPDTPLLRPLLADWLRLRLLTAQRGGEVLAMRRADVDLDTKVWTIPATIAKNKTAHTVPLAPQALAIVTRRIAALDDGCPWLFPNDRNTGPAKDRAKKVLVSDFLPESTDVRGHDLRRTAASGMGRLGVARETISRILNHVDRGPRATSVYDRFDRLPDKRKALERWALELDRIITQKSSGKVVRLGR